MINGLFFLSETCVWKTYLLSIFIKTNYGRSLSWFKINNVWWKRRFTFYESFSTGWLKLNWQYSEADNSSSVERIRMKLQYRTCHSAEVYVRKIICNFANRWRCNEVTLNGPKFCTESCAQLTTQWPTRVLHHDHSQ